MPWLLSLRVSLIEATSRGGVSNPPFSPPLPSPGALSLFYLPQLFSALPLLSLCFLDGSQTKTAAAVPEDDPNSVVLVAPDDPRTPWSAFWPNQACTDIIFYFDADHIENSEAQVVMPIINTLHVIMADFFSRYPEFPWDVAAYVASLTAAHLPTDRIHDYQDMLWEVPADIAGQSENAGVKVVRDDDFVLPRVAIRKPPPPKKLPTWFSKPVKTEAPDPPKSPAPSPSKKPCTGPGPGSPPPVLKAEAPAPSSTVKVRVFGSPP
ncbi:hypothetical protein B0H16DRAFT_1452718, partial [Mycena metata]